MNVFIVNVAANGWGGSTPQSMSITLTTTTKAQPGQDAGLLRSSCTLTENIGKYTFTLLNDTVTSVAPWDAKVNVTNELVYRHPDEQSNTTQGSSVGGFSFLLYQKFQSVVGLRANSSRYTLTTSNNSTFMGPGISADYMKCSDSVMGTVDMTWDDPMADMISMAQEVSLRFVLAATAQNYQPSLFTQTQRVYLNGTNYTIQTLDGLSQVVPTFQIAPVPINETHWSYVLGALAVMLISGLSILPIMLGWWHLGRTFTQSPIEISKAFGAPLLGEGSSNSTAAELVAILGHNRVTYGVSAESEGTAERPIAASPSNSNLSRHGISSLEIPLQSMNSGYTGITNEDTTVEAHLEEDEVGLRQRLQFVQSGDALKPKVGNVFS